MNRILDLYGRTTMTRQESHAKYNKVLSLESMYEQMGLESEADDMVRRGESMTICPDDTTWHTSDGHRRPHLTEEGVRTVIQRPSQAGASSQVEASRQSGSHSQHPMYPGRGNPSMGYGSRQF
jgi:hypothetical protein